MNRNRPAPLVPALLRKPGGPFGWLDARLLHEHWFARMGADAVAVLVLLAIAADRHGASFYGREKMAALLSLDRDAVDRALERLLDLRLIAHRPWRPGHLDGVWQILPVPHDSAPRGNAPLSLAQLLQPPSSGHPHP